MGGFICLKPPMLCVSRSKKKNIKAAERGGIDEDTTNLMKNKKILIKGTVVAMKKNTMDMNDAKASFLDGLHELIGNKISIQLISSVNADPG